MWMIAAAHAGQLEIEVQHSSGEVASLAELRFADEGGDIHRVQASTGAWRGRSLFTPGGHELPLQRGETFEVEVYAPGYARQRHEITMSGRDVHVVFVLEPVSLTPSGDGPAEAAALAAVARWVALSEQRVGGGSDPESLHGLNQEIREARWLATEHTAAWLEEDPGAELARELCLTLAYDAIQCWRPER